MTRLVSTHLEAEPEEPPSAPLTPYPAGSFREVVTLSYPLMIAAMSASFMFFVDRMILGHYSVQVMNAVITASMVTYLFQYSTMSVASIADIYVGQSNGSRAYTKVGTHIWQMLWFSLFTFVIFVPVGLFAGPWLIPPGYEADGLPYFKTLMLGGPLFPAYSCLASFFLGRGQMHLVMKLALAANALNIVLDTVLILGIPGFIPSYGPMGAAIATLCSQAFQVSVLLALFLKRDNRLRFGTNAYRLKPKLFLEQIKIGLPRGLGSLVDSSAWALTTYLLALMAPIYITIAGIGQSIYFSFSFWGEGIQRAVVSSSSNLIGAGKSQLSSQLIRSASYLHICACLILLVPLVFYPDQLITLFIGENALHPEQTILILKMMMLWIWVYFMCDGLVWIFASVLTSAGDTTFTMITNALNAWLFALLPIYFFIYVQEGPPELIWQIFLTYSMMNLACFAMRYKKKAWLKAILSIEIAKPQMA